MAKIAIRPLYKYAAPISVADFNASREIAYEASAYNLALLDENGVIARFGSALPPFPISGAADIILDGGYAATRLFSMFAAGGALMNGNRAIAVNTDAMPSGARYAAIVGATGANRTLTFPAETVGIYNHYLFNATNATDRVRTVSGNQRRMITVERYNNDFYWRFEVFR